MGTTDTMSSLHQLFLYSAVVGGLFFVLRLGLSVLAGHDSDSGGDVHDGDSGGHHDGDSDASFRVLTIQGLTAFFLFGGLAGLVFGQQFRLGATISALGAVVAGVAAMFASAYLVKTLLGLQSAGTLKMENAIGKEGVVYLTIHPNTGGQIQLELQGSLHTFEAVCESGKEIPTGERVWVVGVLNGNVMSVERLPA